MQKWLKIDGFSMECCSFDRVMAFIFMDYIYEMLKSHIKIWLRLVRKKVWTQKQSDEAPDSAY